MEEEGNEKSFTKIREEISDEELNSLMNAIRQRYGIDFTHYEKKSLKRGVARLISKNGMNSLLDLWAKIINNREFFFASIDDLLVNLTEMFRNPEIWVKLRDDVLEQFRTKFQIKVWHAGCSTGEEVYTMAIVLSEMNLYHKSNLTAIDFSNQALDKAKEGRYTKLLWKKYLASYLTYFNRGKLDNYFEVLEEDIKIKDTLKKNISFTKHNLVQDNINKRFQLILCRNVMIYFDDVLKMQILRKFYDALEDDGYFIIGYYDMLPDQSKDLFVLYDANTRIYKKKLK